MRTLRDRKGLPSWAVWGEVALLALGGVAQASPQWYWQHPWPLGNVWLASIWGSGPDDVYAVGAGGTILHNDGTGWSAMDSGTSADLGHVWGRAADEVYAIGDDGTVIRYDGTGWTALPLSPSRLFQARIWSSGPDDVYIVNGYEMYHFDGAAWTTTMMGEGIQLEAIWGSGPNDVYAVGDDGTILHYPGGWLGDVDCDGHVDVADLLWMVDSFGTSEGDPAFDPRCDLNTDAAVDTVDLLFLVNNFGK